MIDCKPMDYYFCVYPKSERDDMDIEYSNKLMRWWEIGNGLRAINYNFPSKLELEVSIFRESNFNDMAENPENRLKARNRLVFIGDSIASMLSEACNNKKHSHDVDNVAENQIPVHPAPVRVAGELRLKGLAVVGLEVGEASFPPGLMRPDPASPGSERELYDMDVIVHLPLKAGAEAGAPAEPRVASCHV